VHGVDEGGDVAAFGFGAGDAVLLFPCVPSFVNSSCLHEQVSCDIPFLARPLVLFAGAVRAFHYAIYIAL